MSFNKGNIVAIIRGVDPLEVISIQEALLEGGINWVEVSLSEEGKGLACIRKLHEKFRQDIYLGVGTVTTADQARKAIAAGARFVLTPGWDKELIQELKKLNVDIYPSVFSPGEVMQALHQNVQVLKLFPAANLGTNYIKNLKGPFPNIDLMAVGGITVDNILDYYHAGCSYFGLGSDLVPRGATKKDKEQIKNKARQYVSVLKNAGV
ncbi:bifunctional 4-hydroxy-2-oxoglutarate aldolase/2-dehydro-3-deoxy-phosphogluconate aldolase [Bacillus chungangensis]|uniref:2-dehydro-3-deoxyphosphogluconate aldolase/(4S)-4-hydroxy-2-oxoglutarate aldolase n=1 Tax=Bacillus chungangensis TaxID=587633 RepID=A0ABT9WWP4_9BACI|nr:bifunctional 4-hydroxy-2-oxoglutarate aldolase/2-dehydro-3-deoxy-phosphogluconate aldolase [Bacillus chungangensis]MDQ0177601.1 2-dehydro-3-deoxyphosphogluconate aldolase/(4S)-4-hydroxy-2-oxoglutarate aldolase [Bacillus chungangensis]